MGEPNVAAMRLQKANRVYLPAEFVKALGWEEGDLLGFRLAGSELRVFRAEIRKRGD